MHFSAPFEKNIFSEAFSPGAASASAGKSAELSTLEGWYTTAKADKVSLAELRAAVSARLAYDTAVAEGDLDEAEAIQAGELLAAMRGLGFLDKEAADAALASGLNLAEAKAKAAEAEVQSAAAFFEAHRANPDLPGAAAGFQEAVARGRAAHQAEQQGT